MTTAQPGRSRPQPVPTQPLDVFTLPLAGVRLIEASAGTGKTWAICALVLRLLLEQRLTIQQILVVTFTNAATAELRVRLRQRLVDTLAGLSPNTADARPNSAETEPGAAAPADPFVPQLLAHLRTLGANDADLAQRLGVALQDFDDAAVFTIHGFCQRALTDTAFAARLPLVQTLLADDSALLAEAVHDFWRQRVAADRLDPALTAHLLAQGDSPQRWAKLLKRQLAKPLSRLVWPADIDLASDRSTLAQVLAQAFSAAQAAWPAQHSTALATLQASARQLHGSYYKPVTVQAAADAWHCLLAHSAAPVDLPPATQKLLALLGTATLQLRTKVGQATPAHPFFDMAQALIDALQHTSRALRLARLRLLRDLLHSAAAQLRQSKRAQRVVAFDDMLFNLHQQLQQDRQDGSAPGLAALLRQRFAAALIDEFQDTDPLQWAVFQAIYAAPDTAALADTQAAPLVLVGDPKQAIYSFRHADLHTYLHARGQALTVCSLAQNQRASAALINALNRLFGQHEQAFMQPGLLHQTVTLGDKPRPVLLDHSLGKEAMPAALQVWTLPRQRNGPLMKADALARAADACANEIARLLAAGRAGSITLAGAPLAAGHIAVLVRSHAQAGLMQRALHSVGVASVALSLASVLQSSDADALARVLAAMLQPGRDGLVKAALASRWHGMAADAIAALAGDEGAWLAALQQFAQHGALWRQQGIGVALQQWRQAAAVAERLLAAPDGARRLTNLLHLGDLLQQASASQPSPEALLRWLVAQQAQPSADDATQLRLESDQHLVQIVTIHRSKGLEYPLVFCPFLWDGRNSAPNDGLDGIAVHDSSCAALVDFRAGLDPAFDASAAKAQAKLDNAAETLRLVYVALTRAVHRCYLVAGSYRSQNGGHVGSGESARSLLNWLVMGGTAGGVAGGAAGGVAGGAAGSGVAAAAWFNPQRKTATPAEIDAVWARLADPPGAGTGTGAGAGTGTDVAYPLAIAIAVHPLPQPLAWQRPLADAAVPVLQALPPPAHLPRGWWIGSYSSLAQGALTGATNADSAPAIDTGLQARASADHDAALAAPALDADGVADGATLDIAASARLPEDDVLHFPRGTLAGEAVHAAFELADFSDPRSWPAAIGQALARLGPPAGNTAAPLAGMLHPKLHSMLTQVLAVPLPVGTAAPLRLATLGTHQRLNELEFHLHAPQLSANALTQTMARHGYPALRLGFGQLQGYLKGFIDLVFQHQGRWFIADWKSNHLGNTAADYGAHRLAAAMAEHHYHLQSLLYSVALQRWLQHRQPGYQHAQHFGGALYLFVRGLRPGWLQADGTPAGLHFHRASAAVLDELSAQMNGPVA